MNLTPCFTVRRTCFVCVEGDTEEVFLKHLGEIFSKRRKVIKIKNSYGKTPSNIIKTAIKCSQNFLYDEKIIVMDGDKAIAEKDKNLLKKHKFRLILSTPCIETVFLEILEKTPRKTFNTSKEYKKEFTKLHLKNKKCLTQKICDNKFKKDVLIVSKSITIARMIKIFKD